jgi:hypothetical protein
MTIDFVILLLSFLRERNMSQKFCKIPHFIPNHPAIYYCLDMSAYRDIFNTAWTLPNGKPRECILKSPCIHSAILKG